MNKLNKKQILVLIIVIICIIGNTICLIITANFYMIKKTIELTSTATQNNITNIYEESIEDNDYYSGVIIYNIDFNINDLFNINIPKTFIEDNKNEYKSTNNECSFSLKQIDNYDNAYLLAQGLNKTYNNTSNIIVSTTNNIKWYEIDYEIHGITYHYLTEIDNKIYSFEFTVNNNEDCINCKDLIINSITIK